ncbi:tRNA(Met) cytidine acetyltransferase [Halomonas sp. ISL-60]|uniref:tRNA(Met) cytidine acetyltransferase TmcA n=1 Tax=Halomonas sp. ISL-56 TaxID=2819149 RepID=UPI001BE6EBCD|nr:GNAT family N-acetyltransferase [Halomonas sp. ISL-56]MBT2773762.1 tRNA(Met) cytidine acetyltransferase [Halomonas sp. ISL-60]MBT2801767.1 tRNA(Met) cytidine acetyltransferase [Halomonas sp. ISL-56]
MGNGRAEVGNHLPDNHVLDNSQQARVVASLVHHARRLARRRWRQLVWLSGDASQCRSMAQALCQAHTWQAPLWVGDEHLSPRKARMRLGAEHQLIVLDTHGSGFDPEALGALAGTITAGGLLVLLTPQPWEESPDPDYARFADHPWHWSELSCHYLSRLARQLQASPKVVRWRVDQSLQLPYLPLCKVDDTGTTDSDCSTADQAFAVKQLVGLKRRRPLVMTADRGRGKSAALGIACARLLMGKAQRIVITAPRLSAVESVFERVAALCPDGRRVTPGQFVLAQGSELIFLPPDVLTEQINAQRQGGDGSYLMVDEAAAIPAALLGHWLSAFPRIAFATTVHGYEGSGRGFALRFRATLERLTPQWKALTLDAPIRWHSGDPLEALVNQLLLLKAPLPIAQPDDSAVVTQVVERGWLAQQDAALEKLFGLLVQSHYRTSPNDLRQLLDGPATQLRTIEQAGEPQAVLVTREEGGFEAALADQVARGQRRPQGHLLAQSLATHAGSRTALTARWRRVARIATHPERRRQGLGQMLLQEDMVAARQQGVALYGATFGAEASLLRFWLAQGFTPVRLGISRETSTGEFAVMVAKALNAEGEAVLADLIERFQAGLPGLLAFELKTLPAAVLVLLLAQMPSVSLSDREWQDVEDVATAHRDPALARPALQALAREASHRSLSEPQQQAHQQLAAWAFQNSAQADAHNDGLKALRLAVNSLIEVK